MTHPTVRTRAQVYRIRLTKYAGGSFVHRETYYEPTRLTGTERRKLSAAGWSIAESRVQVEAEYARLLGLSAAQSRTDASLRGASSACHGYALAAAATEGLATDVTAAATGQGSLRS